MGVIWGWPREAPKIGLHKNNHGTTKTATDGYCELQDVGAHPPERSLRVGKPGAPDTARMELVPPDVPPD